MALAAFVLLLAVWDLSRPPAAQQSGRAAIAVIRGYQRHVSPLIARTGVRCHFTPTCSRYAEAVIARHGLLRGGWRAARRVARCGPWTPMGVVDPPS
jgi:putative membrane protein insertion efficiency factor